MMEDGSIIIENNLFCILIKQIWVGYFKHLFAMIHTDGEHQVEIFDAKQNQFATLDDLVVVIPWTAFGQQHWVKQP